jgi:hypothetical protein
MGEIMNERLMTIFLANGETIKQEYTFIAPAIRELTQYGVAVTIEGAKEWYPPSQIIKVRYLAD